MASVATSSGTMLLPSAPPITHRKTVASAAMPLDADIVDGLPARVERAIFRPRPARVLRPRMNLDFAVLLMRSSYDAIDDIDVVPMDQFQRDFFLIRRAEYESYADAIGPGNMMMQGDLADPNYFDFISFAQYVTINREIDDPLNVFEEKRPVDVVYAEDVDETTQRFDTVVVRRDTSLNLDDLRRRHTELVGGAILDRLIDTFGDTASAIPKIEPRSRPNSSCILASIRQMAKLFAISGFAWDGDASMIERTTGIDENSKTDAAGTIFSITFTSPATLWSGQSLRAKNAALTNDFALKTVRELMSRAGYGIAKSSVKYENFREISTFTLI